MNKWYKLKEKEPASGMACMVAYEFLWNGKKDTHYGKAIWFSECDKIKTYDGKTEVISKSGFYVPLDHRALGIYFGMLIPDIDKVVAWQENDAPCIPQMYESWDFEVIK